ncbi:hypothetical protein HNP81_004828 [Peribacillus huizhouensis]|uniref:Uncharacterized protein n=1 Tax=Peribacillus huizhouensis TaxID=1501239 RepID=A0ABR6CWK9_9BACI|nr:hypothetical protein [Peribacillus huizhouensis]
MTEKKNGITKEQAQLLAKKAKSLNHVISVKPIKKILK